MLAVSTKRLESGDWLDLSPQDERGEIGACGRTTKHFWLARMVSRMTSGGICKKVLLELAHQHHRPLDETRHFLQQPVVLDQFEPECEGEVARRAG
jgi:hypothetical protein